MSRKVAIFFLCIFLFSIPLSKMLVEYSVFLAFPLYVIYRLKNPDMKFFKNKTFIFLVFFALTCFISVFFSGIYFEKSMRAFFSKWIQNFIVFIMAADLFRERRDFERAISFFWAGFIVVLADAVIQKVTGQELLLHRQLTVIKLSYPDVERIYYGLTGTFNHANGLASYMMFSALFLLSTVNVKKGLLRLIHSALFLLAILVLLFTYTRAAWLAFSIGLIILLSLRRSLIIQSVLVGFTCLLFFMPSIRQRIVFSFIAYTDSERLPVWEIALQLIQRSPLFGNGLGTFMDYCNSLSSGAIIKYAHNCYLQMWAESGFLSLALFLAFISSVFIQAWKSYDQNKDSIILGLGVGLLALLVHAFFDVHFYSLQLSALIWGLLGLLAARSWEKNTIL